MYFNYSHMIHSLQQMQQWVNAQQQRITQLEANVQQLQQEVQSLKKNQSSNIERVEYKFDQLKVERLEGTLNIGITPHAGEGSIEDFSVEQNDLMVPPMNPQQRLLLFGNIQRQVHEYLNGDCYSVLNTIEQQKNQPLNSDYRQYIIDDIKKQIDSRIHYYLNQINMSNIGEEQLAEIEGRTVNKVKEDIHKTYDEFITQLPKEGGFLT
ncbi:spore germination protein GerPC [Pseudobacillus sp. FSL P4-0506]|uniref:spore germination protein GerPC n=1 Tax=unclassified Pseudobacillus TaxID=2619284 RepID=UPI0030FA0F81